MEALTIVVGLLILITLVATALKRFSVPQPTVMVVVGSAVGFIPSLPHIALPSDLVLLVFLPPLLYSHAWYINWNDFSRNLVGIGSLSVVLLFATTVSVSVVAHAVVPEMGWDVAFLLGAILCATDGIAASLIAHRMGLPHRLSLLIEGEGLLNDAVAILLYKLMLSVVVAESFDPTETVRHGVVSAFGGIVIGLAVGWLGSLAHRFTHDAKLETVETMLTPFVAYVPAEAFHLSGVLAVVTTGLYLGNRQAYLFTFSTRLQATAVWDVATFVLNGLIFLLVGLQMPSIVKGVSHYGVERLALYAAVVCTAVLLTRLVWLYLGVAIERALRLPERLSMASATVLGWAGMRGAISLTAVLALPAVTESGAPFLHQDLLAFLIFAVILCSLVFQSLTLPMLMKASGLCTARPSRYGVSYVRQMIAKKVAERLSAVVELPRSTVKSVIREYLSDVEQSPQAPGASDVHVSREVTHRDVAQRAIDIERQVVLDLHRRGEIDDEAMHAVLRDMDLREARLAFSSSVPLH